jgi:hypothetical protein
VLLVAWFSTATITAVPSGFTQVGTVITGATAAKLAIYQKVAGGSEPATYDVTMSATSSFARSVIMPYTGMDPAGFVTGVVATQNAATSLTLTWPAITRTGVGTIVCVGVQVSSRTPSAPPAGYTDQYTTVPRGHYYFDRLDAPDGANGTFNRTLDNSSGGHATARFLIVEAPVIPPDPGGVAAQVPLLLS